MISFINREVRDPFRFGTIGTLIVLLANHLPLWWCGEGDPSFAFPGCAFRHSRSL